MPQQLTENIIQVDFSNYSDGIYFIVALGANIEYKPANIAFAVIANGSVYSVINASIIDGGKKISMSASGWYSSANVYKIIFK